MLANRVAAGVTRPGRSRRGCVTLPERFAGESVVVRRPKHFFDPKGSLRETAMLELTTPSRFHSLVMRAAPSSGAPEGPHS